MHLREVKRRNNSIAFGLKRSQSNLPNKLAPLDVRLYPANEVSEVSFLFPLSHPPLPFFILRSSPSSSLTRCILSACYSPGIATDAKDTDMAPTVPEREVAWRQTFNKVHIETKLQTLYSLTQPWLEKVIIIEANCLSHLSQQLTNNSYISSSSSEVPRSLGSLGSLTTSQDLESFLMRSMLVLQKWFLNILCNDVCQHLGDLHLWINIFQVTHAWCYKIIAWVKDPFKVQEHE